MYLGMNITLPGCKIYLTLDKGECSVLVISIYILYIYVQTWDVFLRLDITR